jgi:hypothetical protein
VRHSATFLQEILQRAIEALEAGRVRFVSRRDSISRKKVFWHLDRDIERLSACCRSGEIPDKEEYRIVILECLETALEDPAGTYTPPIDYLCSHKEARGQEMFAFVVTHEDFTLPIYTKFSLIEEKKGTWYISIDCHPSV